MSNKLPESPSEPEKYSIDEMMDRLKNSSSEVDDKGELVTRSDGSKAMKVRKRRRRSDQQAKKEAKKSLRMKIAQISGVLVILILSALAAGVAIIHANSRSYLEKLTKSIEYSSGATAEINQFRVNPKTADAGQIVLNWPEGNLLKQAALRQLSAEIHPSTFLGREMSGEEVSIEQVDIALQIPNDARVTQNSISSVKLPSIQFDHYRTPNFNLVAGPASNPFLSIKKSQSSISYLHSGSRTQISLFQGNLVIAGWPKLRLDRSLLVLRDDEADVVSLRILHESDDRGALTLTGKISPFRQDRINALAVQFDAFQLSGIAGSELGGLLSGKIDSPTDSKLGQLTFFPTGKPLLKFEAPFQGNPSSPIELRGFPFLFALFQAMEDPWFERPIFSDASGIIYRDADMVSIRDLNLKSSGRITIRGSLTLAADQSLSGDLQVGIAETLLATTKNRRFHAIFGQPQKGFQWLNLKIGGSASAPTDDLEQQFTSAVVPPSDTPATEATKKSTFEELTNDSEKAK